MDAEKGWTLTSVQVGIDEGKLWMFGDGELEIESAAVVNGVVELRVASLASDELFKVTIFQSGKSIAVESHFIGGRQFEKLQKPTDVKE